MNILRFISGLVLGPSKKFFKIGQETFINHVKVHQSRRPHLAKEAGMGRSHRLPICVRSTQHPSSDSVAVTQKSITGLCISARSCMRIGGTALFKFAPYTVHILKPSKSLNFMFVLRKLRLGNVC
jgi:hypothetical protein